jgi:hypothetical protein
MSLADNDAKFDPRGAVTFDLQRGRVCAAPEERVVLVGAKLGPEGARGLGLAMGKAAGARIASSLGGVTKVREASLDVVVNHLAGELSVRGVGLLTIERWGRAMVVAVENPCATSGELIAGIIEGAFVESTGRDLGTAPIGDGNPVRVLLANPQSAARARALAGQGHGFSAVLTKLQEGA